MKTQSFGPGDLVALQDNGKTLRGIVSGSPISGVLKIDVPSKAKPYYLAVDQVELLVRANYDIHAEEPPTVALGDAVGSPKQAAYLGLLSVAPDMHNRWQLIPSGSRSQP